MRRRVLRWLLVCVVLVGVVAIPSSTAAQPHNPLDICEGHLSPDPEFPDTGISGVMLTPQRVDYLEEGDFRRIRSMPYMTRGLAGTQWHAIVTENCMDPNRVQPLNSIANSIWEFSRAIAGFVIFTHQLAAGGDILDWLADAVAKMVVFLREGIWRPLVPSVIILGAVTLAWWGLVRKRATLTMEGALWMVFAMVIGMVLFTNPRWTMDTAADITNAGGALIHSVLTDETAGISRCPPQGVNRMELQDSENPDHVGADEVPSVPSDTPDVPAVWIQSETLFSVLVCEPWMIGVFGNSPNHSEAAELYAMQAYEAQGFSYGQMPSYREGGQIDQDMFERQLEIKDERYRAVSEQVYNYYPEAWGAWSGSDSGHRLSVAGGATAGVFMAGLLIFVVSLSIIVLKVLFFFMLLFAPVVFLIGIHPGVGRNIVMRYLENLAGILMKQIFLQLLLAIFLVLYSVVIGLPVPYLVKVFLLLVVLVATFLGRKPLANALGAASPGAMGRVMGKVANDKTFERAHMALNPYYAAYRLDRKAREKFSPLIGQTLGSMVGGSAGGAIGQKLGQKNSERLRKNKNPEDAPPMSEKSPGDGESRRRWDARDVTPPSRTTPRSEGRLPTSGGELGGGGGAGPRPDPGPGSGPGGAGGGRPGGRGPRPGSGPGGAGGGGPRPRSGLPAGQDEGNGRRVVIRTAQGGQMIVHRPNVSGSGGGASSGGGAGTGPTGGPPQRRPVRPNLSYKPPKK